MRRAVVEIEKQVKTADAGIEPAPFDASEGRGRDPVPPVGQPLGDFAKREALFLAFLVKRPSVGDRRLQRRAFHIRIVECFLQIAIIIEAK